MPIDRYDGKTYVAFLDISGFKEIMNRERQAAEALDRFYSTVYRVGRGFIERTARSGLLQVNAIVVSDCAVLFARNAQNDAAKFERDKTDGL